jgi:hypothetical protein
MVPSETCQFDVSLTSLHVVGVGLVTQAGPAGGLVFVAVPNTSTVPVRATDVTPLVVSLPETSTLGVAYATPVFAMMIVATTAENSATARVLVI